VKWLTVSSFKSTSKGLICLYDIKKFLLSTDLFEKLIHCNLFYMLDALYYAINFKHLIKKNIADFLYLGISNVLNEQSTLNLFNKYLFWKIKYCKKKLILNLRIAYLLQRKSKYSFENYHDFNKDIIKLLHGLLTIYKIKTNA